MLIDFDDEAIEHSTRNVSGYDALVDRLIMDLQSNTDLTRAELFNEYAKGMADTGKVEQQNANDRSRRYQESKLDSNLYDFLELVLQCKDGPTKGEVPDDWDWKWNELYPVTPVEQAELELMRSQIDQINIAIGAYTGEEAARSHYSGSEYNPEITINWEERERLKKEQEQLAAQQAEQQAEQDRLALELGLSPQGEESAPEDARGVTDSSDRMDKPCGEGFIKDGADSLLPFTPPLSVQTIAKQGLDLHRCHGTPQNTMNSFYGRQMAAGQPVTQSAAQQIKQQNDLLRRTPGWDNPDRPSPEFIGYLMRGGVAGQQWIDQVVQRIPSKVSDSDEIGDLDEVADSAVSEETSLVEMTNDALAPRTDDDTPIKKAIDWYQYQIGLQYQPMDTRHGKILPVGYGEFLGLVSDHDGMNLDVYVGPDLSSKRVFAITQLDRETGAFDEVKFFIGCDRSPEEIAEIYKSIMTPEHFGGIEEIPMETIPSYEPPIWMRKMPINPDNLEQEEEEIEEEQTRSDASDDRVLSEEDYGKLLDSLPLDAIDSLVDWDQKRT
jgi:hypothetical protein